ncbi:hypothetical protein [Paenibacillus sp. JDR-2]|uniref:hypothetical protein n=1 Tax=Paenibacillus sp. (strain JDR-2) TaxID=324057 RepID=UPI0001663B80|nr:hypothetical protein [Paenibacillus sp. JDR-2]ACT00884.1 hypothetical protein Pjdr2_2228 [Paenibacillus sp. JDR-2]
MKLISFLLENIYWVIVVGGVLFSMFGRSGAKKRTNRMPSFGGSSEREPHRPEHRQDPVWDEDDEEEYQPQKPILAGSPLQGERGGTGEGSRSQTQERALQAVPSRPAEPPRARLAAANKPQTAAAPAAASQTEMTNPKADELRKAVVWAEILAPPRSKRPFGK